MHILSQFLSVYPPLPLPFEAQWPKTADRPTLGAPMESEKYIEIIFPLNCH